MLDPDGNFNTFVLAKERVPIPVDAPNMNFWLMTLLHSWYADIVEEQYPKLMERYLLDGPDGTKWIEPHPPFGEGPEAQRTAMDMAWAACCASEVGDTETLAGLLGYADRFMNATWEDGAYYYKRRDSNFDEQGNFIGMDPASGNAMYGYARLNVKDGLRKLYEGPFDDRHFAQPALVGLPADLDIRRAIFDAERNALVLTLGALGQSRRIQLDVRAPSDNPLPMVIRDGEELEAATARTATGVSVTLEHCERATLVLQW